MYKRIVFVLVLLLASEYSAASVTEIEPDDITADAFPLSTTDATVGQLNGSKDTDIYSITVANAGGPPIPVYFGCNVVIGDWMTAGVTEADESNWTVHYWGPGETALPPIVEFGDVTAAHSFVVGKEDCRQGLADISGPMRFEINASVAGTYYIAVRGRHIGRREVTIDGKPVPVDAWIANTGAYTLRAITKRETGEMEPNDGQLEAYPLPADSPVTAQLSSMWDEDWFYIRTEDASPNRTTSIYMSCAIGSGGSNGANDPLFLVSTYDPNGNPQSSYQIGATRCTADGGFKFSINTPAKGDYYVKVTAPTYNENARYSDLDYKLSQFYQINDGGGSGGSGSFTGTIRKATITDNAAAGKDRFNVVLNNCNNGGVGNLTLSGNKLDFPTLAETMQIKVQVGGWSCLTDSTTFAKDANNPSKTIYKYSTQ